MDTTAHPLPPPTVAPFRMSLDNSSPPFSLHSVPPTIAAVNNEHHHHDVAVLCVVVIVVRPSQPCSGPRSTAEQMGELFCIRNLAYRGKNRKLTAKQEVSAYPNS
jgi:hypothetical protein